MPMTGLPQALAPWHPCPLPHHRLHTRCAQILNLPELLQRCNAWSHTDPASGRAYGAACAAYQPGADLPANMAGVRG